MAVDVAGASKKSGANVHLYTYNNSSAQRWKFIDNGDGSYSIRSDVSGNCFDVAGGSSKNGANVCVYAPNGTKAQKWTIRPVDRPVKDGTYRISSGLSDNKVIDLSGASQSNSAAVQLYADNGTIAQAWNVIYDASSGYDSVFSARSGRAIDIAGGSKSSGARVQHYSSNRTAAQLWYLLPTSDGHVEFISALSGKALDVPGASVSNGKRLQVYNANHSRAQKWVFNLATVDLSVAYQVKTTVNEASVLDVAGGSKAASAATQVWGSNRTLAQKWIVERQDDGSYTLQNANSGLYLTEVASKGIEYRDTLAARSYWLVDASLNG